ACLLAPEPLDEGGIVPDRGHRETKPQLGIAAIGFRRENSSPGVGRAAGIGPIDQQRAGAATHQVIGGHAAEPPAADDDRVESHRERILPLDAEHAPGDAPPQLNRRPQFSPRSEGKRGTLLGCPFPRERAMSHRSWILAATLLVAVAFGVAAYAQQPAPAPATPPPPFAPTKV